MRSQPFATQVNHIYPAVPPDRYFDFLDLAAESLRGPEARGVINLLGSGIRTKRGMRFCRNVENQRLYRAFRHEAREVVTAELCARYRGAFQVPEAKDILACQGASVGLGAIAHRLKQRAGRMHALCPKPNYGAIPELFRAWNVPIVTCSHDEVLKMVSEDTLAVFLTDPCNPLASQYSADWSQSLFEAVSRFQVEVVCDQAFLGMCHHSALSEYSHHPNLIQIRSFSKMYGLTESKCGFIVARPEIIRETRSALHGLAGHLATEPMVQGICVLDKLASLDHAAQLRAEALQPLVDEHLEKLARRGLIGPVVPNTLGISFPDIGVKDTYTFCRRACAEFQLALTPGRYFDFGHSKHVRLGWGKSSERAVERGLLRFRQALEAFGQDG